MMKKSRSGGHLDDNLAKLGAPALRALFQLGVHRLQMGLS